MMICANKTLIGTILLSLTSLLCNRHKMTSLNSWPQCEVLIIKGKVLRQIGQDILYDTAIIIMGFFLTSFLFRTILYERAFGGRFYLALKFSIPQTLC